MPVAGDGKEFGNSLNDCQEDHFKRRHRREKGVGGRRLGVVGKYGGNGASEFCTTHYHLPARRGLQLYL
jgi:hypothetical protein